MVFQTFRQFAEGLAITRQAMYISIAGNVLNIILNYIFIHGKFGSPSYGVMGAGLATLTARIFMAISMYAFVFYNIKFRGYWNIFSNIRFFEFVSEKLTLYPREFPTKARNTPMIIDILSFRMARFV